MLVLSRKRNQKITIGEKITITVPEVRGSQVRLGISPRTMAVEPQRGGTLEKVRGPRFNGQERNAVSGDRRDRLAFGI